MSDLHKYLANSDRVMHKMCSGCGEQVMLIGGAYAICDPKMLVVYTIDGEAINGFRQHKCLKNRHARRIAKLTDELRSEILMLEENE